MRPSRSAAELIVGSSRPLLGAPRPPSAGRLQAPVTGKAEKRFIDISSLRSPRRNFTYDPLVGLTKFEFGMGTEHGLHWDGTVVIRVTDQAQKYGVKPGWKIHMVDSHVVRSGEEIWSRLQEARWQWRSCCVWFVTDRRTIREEQARQRVAEIQAETERLAKLPFAGASDATHLEQLREEFSFKGYIDRLEDRGITLEQLRRVVKWSKERGHRWRDTDPPERSRTSRQHLRMDIMNFHHINHWLVRPATREKDCSLVEMMASQKQPPAWFIVHWWGELLVDFMKCLELQTSSRRLGGDACYWIGAFSNRQHSLTDDVTSNPRESCYYRAMAAAGFKVLLCLDREAESTGPATALHRAWCDYEVMMCLNEPRAALDVVMCNSHKAVLVTTGLTEEEKEMEKASPGSGYRAKEMREKAFNMDVVELGLGTQLQAAHTTNPEDRQRILNGVANRDQSQPLLEKHESYGKASCRLRALFALAFWRRAMAASGSDSEMHRIQGKLADALRSDAWRESLDMSMAFMAGGDEKLKLLARSLPPRLKELTLDLRGMDLTDDMISAFGTSIPRGLESLHLDISNNSHVGYPGIEGLINKLPHRQRSISLELKNTGVPAEVLDKRDSLNGLRQYITDEAEKGNTCIIVNLIPSATRRMIMTVVRSKC